MTRSRHHAAIVAVVDQHATDLADMVTELTDQTKRREVIGAHKRNDDGSQTWVTRDRWTTHPSLLEQLHQATYQDAQSDLGGRPGYMSKPTARVEAIDALARIDSEASRWLDHLGSARVGGTAQRVRRVGSLTPSLDKPTRDAVAADVRRWHTWARIFAGWEEPPWKPSNTCPLCGHRGGLRVRLDLRSAVCGECKETWGPDTIGLLADHIRAEAEEAGTLRGVSAVWVGRPCHCAACDPEYRYWRLCPSCGHVEGACAKPADHRFPCTGPVV